jgi:hypothetical protein
MTGLVRARDCDRPRRGRRGRRKTRWQGPPYATINCREALFVACRLSHAAMRIWALAHAAWVPAPDGRGTGRAILPRSHIRTPMPELSEERRAPAPGNDAIQKGFKELATHQLVVLKTEASRPGKAGGARGQAAEYRVPPRDGPYEAALPFLPAWPEGPRPNKTKLRLPVARIRADAAELTPVAFTVLIYAIASRMREKDGSLAVGSVPLDVRPKTLALHMGLAPRRAARAVEELVAEGRLVVIVTGSGRRPACYEPAPVYRRGLKEMRRDNQHAPAAAVVHG